MKFIILFSICFSSGQQLVEHRKKVDDFVLVSRGNKTNEDLECVEPDLNKTVEYLENLRCLLSLERVSTKISKGIYEQDKHRVKVLSHFGKLRIGYFEENENYLRPHEALFQIEMKKLEVTFDSVIMSVEQAYAIFLDPENEVSFEEYLVYAYLLRAGYFVEQHDSVVDAQKYQASLTEAIVQKEDRMIWAVLMEKLNLPFPFQLIKDESQLYEQTKSSMENICESISGKYNESTGVVPSSASTKRDLSPQGEEESNKKRRFSSSEQQDQNFLDILKVEAEYSSHQEIFNKISFIKRAEVFEHPILPLKVSFDVFLPKKNFKRTEDLPNYRIVVIK